MKISRKNLRKLITETLLNEELSQENFSNKEFWTESTNDGIKQFMYNFSGERNKLKYEDRSGNQEVINDLSLIIIRDKQGTEIYLETTTGDKVFKSYGWGDNATLEIEGKTFQIPKFNKLEGVSSEEGDSTQLASTTTTERNRVSDWDTYVEKTRDKISARKIRDTWKKFTELGGITAKNSFMGFVKWYNTTRKNQKMMDIIDKNASDHMSPSQVIQIMEKVDGTGGFLVPDGETIDPNTTNESFSHGALIRKRYGRY